MLSLVGISTDACKLASFDIPTRDNIQGYQCNNPIILGHTANIGQFQIVNNRPSFYDNINQTLDTEKLLMFEEPTIKIYQCVKGDIDLCFASVNITFTQTPKHNALPTALMGNVIRDPLTSYSNQTT